MKKLFKHYRTTLFFTVLFLFAIIGLYIIDEKYIPANKQDDFFENLLVEAHGILGDLLIFGIVLSIYDSLRDRKEKFDAIKIKQEKLTLRYKEEIDDFRGWYADEAKFRILGNMNRLRRLGFSEFNLKECYLINTKFLNKEFYNTSFEYSLLAGSFFSGCLFESCSFAMADLTRTVFHYDCGFNNVYLGFSKLHKTRIYGIDLKSDSITSDSLEEISRKRVIIDEHIWRQIKIDNQLKQEFNIPIGIGTSTSIFKEDLTAFEKRTKWYSFYSINYYHFEIMKYLNDELKLQIKKLNEYIFSDFENYSFTANDKGDDSDDNNYHLTGMNFTTPR